MAVGQAALYLFARNLSLLRYITPYTCTRMRVEGMSRRRLVGSRAIAASKEGRRKKVPMHETVRRKSLNYLTRETSIIGHAIRRT